MMLFFQLLSIIGSFSSLIGLVFLLRPSGQVLNLWQIGLFAVGLLLLIIAIILLIQNYLKKRPRSMPIGPKVNEYMYKWIKQGGKVAILTRDMSWVDNDKMKELLRSKAHHSELCLCLPNEIALSQELKQLGAQVHTFSELNYVPESRFTIVNKDRMDAQLAVGRSHEQKHLIEECSLGEHPVFSIANDLVNFIIKFDQWKCEQVSQS